MEEISLPANLFASALGTIGGGNHFYEVQTLVDGKGAFIVPYEQSARMDCADQSIDADGNQRD